MIKKGRNCIVPALFLISILCDDRIMDIYQKALHLSGTGKIAEAMDLLHEAVDSGDGKAAFILANWRFEGALIRRDIGQARDMFLKSANLGYEDAEHPLIALLASGAGGLSRDWHGALRRLRLQRRGCSRSVRQLELIDNMPLSPDGEPVTTYPPSIVSQEPLIAKFENFLTADECDELIAMATSSFSPSLVVHPISGSLIHDKIRTSSAAAFPLLDENPFLHAINRRIAIASRSLWEQGEPAQVLHYKPGQEYKLHSDTLREGNQRIQTFLIYLNEDFDGGETFFPHGNQYYKLPKGDAICFSNVMANMQPAKDAVHAGLPVKQGQKIILSRWIRQYPLDLSGPPNRPF